MRLPSGYFVLLFAALASVPAGAASELRGVVRELIGDKEVGVREAAVLAKSGRPETTVAVAETDSAGRFRLSGLPAGRITFSIKRRGYYTVEAGGVGADLLVRACTGSGDCGEADFLLVRTGVVEGWVVDPWGDPLEGVHVFLTREGDSLPPIGDRRRPYRAEFRAQTDDRGYFRLYGVRPGRYQLEFEPAGPSRRLRGSFRADPLEIEAAPGITLAPVHQTMRLTARKRVSVSGVIEGVDFSDGKRRALIMVRKDRGGSGSEIASTYVMFLAGGQREFRFQGVEPGDHALYLRSDVEGVEFRNAPAVPLAKLKLEGDVTNLVVRPGRRSGFSGRVRFDGDERRAVTLRFVPLDERGAPWRLTAMPPMMRFKVHNLFPGEYRVVTRSSDYFLWPEPRVLVQEGVVGSLDVTVSTESAALGGLVRPAAKSDRGESSRARFRVGLRRVGEQVRVAGSVQTDQHGKFLFEKVAPGEYEICAWPAADAKVTSDELWQQAGEAVRRFTVEPGDEIEIVLTAAPSGR